MSKAEFAEGLIAKKGYWNKADEPHVKISIKVEEFIQWLKENESKGWVNVEVKTSKKGNVFAVLDTWTPDKDKTETGHQGSPAPANDLEPQDDDLPF